MRDGLWSGGGVSNVLNPQEGRDDAGIHDLREANKCLPRARSSPRGIRDPIGLVRECEWGATLDLRKGCYQVLMRPEARQFPGAEFGGGTIVANALPFGLSIAPHIFQTLASSVGRL